MKTRSSSTVETCNFEEDAEFYWHNIVIKVEQTLFNVPKVKFVLRKVANNNAADVALMGSTIGRDDLARAGIECLIKRSHQLSAAELSSMDPELSAQVLQLRELNRTKVHERAGKAIASALDEHVAYYEEEMGIEAENSIHKILVAAKADPRKQYSDLLVSVPGT